MNLLCVEFFSIDQHLIKSDLTCDTMFSIVSAIDKQNYLDLLIADQNRQFPQSLQSRKGKFIQVFIKQPHFSDNLEILAFMPFTSKIIWYHAAILRELLTRLHIDGDFPKAKQHLKNYEYCDFDTDILQVLGGGYYELDPDCLLLRLSGQSTAYGRFEEQSLLNPFANQSHCFSNYQLLIT